jgi:hypothetical protein
MSKIKIFLDVKNCHKIYHFEINFMFLNIFIFLVVKRNLIFSLKEMKVEATAAYSLI